MLRILTFILFIVTAATAGAVTLTLDRAADYALAHNKTLAAAKLRIEEARGRVLGAGRLKNPEFQADFEQNAHAPERAVRLEFMQRFPLTSRLRLEKSVSRAQLAAADAEVRDAARRLVAEVRQAAVKVVALQSQREVRQQQLANSREQSEFVRKRVEAGEASTIDATMIDLESQQLEVEILQLETQRAALIGELRPLLGVEASSAVDITGTLAAPAAPPGKGASGTNRADLEAARHGEEAARRAVDLAKAQKWEDIGVGLTASGERTEDAPEGYSNDYFLGFRFSLPLPLWNRNEGPIAEATASATRARLETDALALTIRTEAETAREEMAALSKLLAEMDGRLLPMAAQLEEQLRTTYATGQTPLNEVLRARTRRLELAQRRVDALRDYHLARVRYDAALGQNTPSRGRAGK